MSRQASGLRLRDASGRGLDLAVLRYEFPDPREDSWEWDANWLVLHGEVDDGTRRWEFTHPCMETHEAQETVRWLRAAGDGRAPATLRFLEPLLAFRIGRQAGGSVQLTVTFDAEAGRPDHNAPWSIGLVVPSAHLHAAADAWAAHLDAFPER